MIRAVLRLDSTGIACSGAVEPGSPFVHDGLCPAYVGIEMAAQAAALLGAEPGLFDGGTEYDASLQGYLVRVRQAEFQQSHFAADTEIRVEVMPDGGTAPLRRYRCVLAIDDDVILRGSFSVYLDPGHRFEKQNH